MNLDYASDSSIVDEFSPLDYENYLDDMRELADAGLVSQIVLPQSVEGSSYQPVIPTIDQDYTYAPESAESAYKPQPSQPEEQGEEDEEESERTLEQAITEELQETQEKREEQQETTADVVPDQLFLP